jgi:hypothetical protein
MSSQPESTTPQVFLVNGKRVACAQCGHDRFIGPEALGERHLGVQCSVCAHMEIFGRSAKVIQPFAPSTHPHVAFPPKPELADVLTKVLDERHLTPFGLLYEKDHIVSPERNLRCFLEPDEIQCLRDEIERLRQCEAKPIDVP